MADIAYRTADVDGLSVFYREAGTSDAPTLVLLHGFPSASHMFRELIPRLADRFHLVAPDLPGFGQSEMPPREEFAYNRISQWPLTRERPLSGTCAMPAGLRTFLDSICLPGP